MFQEGEHVIYKQNYKPIEYAIVNAYWEDVNKYELWIPRTKQMVMASVSYVRKSTDHHQCPYCKTKWTMKIAYKSRMKYTGKTMIRCKKCNKEFQITLDDI